MLHSTGVGTNQSSINVGPSANMPSVGGSNNVPYQNFYNLPKIVEQTPQPHYGIQNYSSCSNSPLNMVTNMSQYQSLFSTNGPNTTSQNSDLNSHNSVYCTESSVHHTSSSIYSSSYLYKHLQNQDIYNQKKLNHDPVVPEIASTSNVLDKLVHNKCNEQSDTEEHEKVKKYEMDSKKRKSLEKTVRLIENILNNCSKRDNSALNCTEVTNNYNIENNHGTDSESEVNHDNDSKEQFNPSKVKLENVEVCNIELNIKEEVTNWGEPDTTSPFYKDVNGIKREDVQNFDIIDANSSIQEATAIVKSGLESNVYLECPHCSLIFNHPKRFLIHTKWHSFGLTNEKRLEIAKAKELKRNQRKEARVQQWLSSKEITDFTTEGKTFPCKDCDKVFSGKASLRSHRMKFHPPKPRECKICNKTISSWKAMRTHLASHTHDAKYQCSECPKKFKYAHSLATHRDTHKEKTHGCDECPKKFGSAALLKTHMKTHERALKGATFSCMFCAKGFYSSYSLQVHERTSHRNERPFRCETCNSTYGTNSALKKHIKMSHNKSKPHECSICHRSFVTASIRDRHEIRTHRSAEEFEFQCKECNNGYVTLKELQKHTYKVHPKGRKRKKTSESD